VLESLTPQQLARAGRWRGHPRRAAALALAALEGAAAILTGLGHDGSWGPAGAVGFELASGLAVTTAASDLDLVVQLDAPLAHGRAAALLAALEALPVRADVLLETPCGALALTEYVHGPRPFLVRGADGPLLRDDPWGDAAVAA
jgi:phosphoribosyl-dephospho-CoA transferase